MSKSVTYNLPRSNRFESLFNLFWALVTRDISSRYRRSILGPAWAVIQPLFMMVIFNFIKGFVEIPSDGIPYPIFSYSALVPWAFFTSAVSGCASSMLGNASLIKKMAVAREVFLFVAIVNAAFDMAMSSFILAGLMIWFQVPVNWSLLWLLPLLLLTGLLALSVGMVISALGTFKRDFIFATGFLLQIWLYATPIIYPLSSVPKQWSWLYILNPMVGILEGFRSVLARGQSPDLVLLAWALPGLVLAFIVAWPLFRFMSSYMADVL